MQQTGHLEQRRLLSRQPISGRLPLGGLRIEVVPREAPPTHDLRHQLEVLDGRRTPAVASARRVVDEALGQGVEVAFVVEHPARAVRRSEVGGEVGVRRHHAVGPPDPAPTPPPRVALDLIAPGVLRPPRLFHRPHPAPASATVADKPLRPIGMVLHPHRAALDLEHDDACARQQHDQVGLVVLLLVDDPHVRQQRGAMRQG